MFRVFAAVFLSFSRVFTGVGRGKKSLVFWVVFLGFCLNTKEWKIRVVFQLQPTLRDSSPTTDPPPTESISSRFSVIFESILSRFRTRLENDSKSTRKRLKNDSKSTLWEGGRWWWGIVAEKQFRYTKKETKFPEVDKRVVFQKGRFWRMFPRNENRNEGTFAKTTLLRNRFFFFLSLGETLRSPPIAL